MNTFVVIVAVIIIIIVMNKVIKKRRGLSELMSSIAYVDFVKPLELYLTSKGYTFKYSSPQKGSNGYARRVDIGSKSSGTIYFATYPKDLDWLRNSLKNRYLANDDSRQMAIEFGDVGFILYSSSYVKHSPEIPELFTAIAQWFSGSGFRFKHPDWYYEHPNIKKYLNVIF